MKSVLFSSKFIVFKSLQHNQDARVIYVSPSPSIALDLSKFRKELYDSIVDREAAEDVFSRFHIFSLEEFPRELEKLVQSDPYINW